MDPGTRAETVDRPTVKYEEDVDEEGEEDLLADYFEKSASAVRRTFGQCVSKLPKYMLELRHVYYLPSSQSFILDAGTASSKT